jgi:NADH dehydrogenase FAD-containing subunit
MACKTAMPMGAHVADNIARRLAGLEERPFSFRDGGVCVSLGRVDGVIQSRRIDGIPAPFVFTGKIAAWMKEQVCRYALSSLERERRGKPYRWWRAAPARQSTARALGISV